MESNSGNAPLDHNQQYLMAKLLLEKYDTFHPFLQMQMEGYTVACCSISLGGDVKMHADKKKIIYDIKTEKNFVRKGQGFHPVSKNNKKQQAITKEKYSEEKNIAKLNLVTWTKHLLWGDKTVVEVIIDGSKCK